MSKPVFDPVDTSFDSSLHSARDKDDVESPSLTNGNALARFEFEPGKSSKDGTKVLMVEWEEDVTTRDIASEWSVSWEGKKTVLPAQDPPAEGQEAPVNRLYFMLGPGVNVPTSVKLQKGHIQWRTTPLPAIFSPELGATARQAGKKGVLHTIWAKKRLQVLQKEIDAESKVNAEGIGLEMAIAERDWIEQNFGVTTKPSTTISIPSTTQQQQQQTAANGASGPASPRSPGGSRLMDKLKGLKLGTTASDLNGGLTPRDTAPNLQNTTTTNNNSNPLSPEQSDVAVGSSFGAFAALKGFPPPAHMAAKPAQPASQQKRIIAAQRPPEAVTARQPIGMGSLNAAVSSSADGGGFTGLQRQESMPLGGGDNETEDDLFALPMSPRSPEMAKSPFSFANEDTMKYLQMRAQ